MRATLCPLSALALFVLGDLADHPDHATPADDLALVAHFLDAASYLHDSLPLRLLVAVDDASPRQVIGRQLHQDPVARQDADEVLPHLAADVRQDPVLV